MTEQIAATLESVAQTIEEHMGCEEGCAAYTRAYAATIRNSERTVSTALEQVNAVISSHPTMTELERDFLLGIRSSLEKRELFERFQYRQDFDDIVSDVVGEKTQDLHARSSWLRFTENIVKEG